MLPFQFLQNLFRQVSLPDLSEQVQRLFHHGVKVDLLKIRIPDPPLGLRQRDVLLIRESLIQLLDLVLDFFCRLAVEALLLLLQIPFRVVDHPCLILQHTPVPVFPTCSRHPASPPQFPARRQGAALPFPVFPPGSAAAPPPYHPQCWPGAYPSGSGGR